MPNGGHRRCLVPLLVDIRGLRGGHCEFDIHFERGNAIVLIGRFVRKAMQAGAVQIARISGGVSRGARPVVFARSLTDWQRAARRCRPSSSCRLGNPSAEGFGSPPFAIRRR